MAEPRRVVLYTQPECSACRQEKEFLVRRNVPFVERNIREDPQAAAELERLGARSTPVTVVGETVLFGFRPNRLAELLQREGLLP